MANKTIFSNQHEVAEDIRKVFENGDRYVIMQALPQSGKTGAMMAFINILTELNEKGCNERFNIQSIYFITGDNQDIMKQTKEDFEEYNKTYNFSKYFKPHNNVFFFKNSDLQKHNRNNNFKELKENTLIFLDESHYGTRKENNSVPTFLKEKVGINYMTYDDNDKKYMNEKNIYLINVSATPYLEEANDTNNHKPRVTLKPGDGYIGFKYFAENLKITTHEDKSIFNNENECFNFFNNVLYTHIEEIKKNKGLYKIIIVRTDDETISTIKKNAEEKFRFLDLYMDKHEHKKIDLSKMYEDIDYYSNEKKAKEDNIDISKPLIVLIKGTFRMGIRIRNSAKNMIGAIVDISFSKDVTPTEQGLLGRMCGYYTDYEDIEIHISEKHYELLKAHKYGEIDNPLKYRINKSSKKWGGENEQPKTDNVFVDTDPNTLVHKWYNVTNFLTDEDRKNILNNNQLSRSSAPLRKLLQKLLCNELVCIGEGVTFEKQINDGKKEKRKFEDYIYAGGRRCKDLNDNDAKTTTTSGFKAQQEFKNIGKYSILYAIFTNVIPNEILIRITFGRINWYEKENSIESIDVEERSTYVNNKTILNDEDNNIINKQVNDKKRKYAIK